MNNSLNKSSSSEQKRDASEAVFELLSEYLFDTVNLVNSPGLTTSTDVVSTTDYGMLFRVIDTSEGKYFRPDRKSRLRMNFYFTDNMLQTDAYILSPATTQLFTGVVSTSQLDAYVGIKVYAGQVYLVSKDSKGEKVTLTDFQILDDTTYIIDILYNITHAEVKIDGRSLGTVSCNLLENLYNLKTVYPLIAPIRSINGSTVKITSETFQFLQDK